MTGPGETGSWLSRDDAITGLTRLGYGPHTAADTIMAAGQAGKPQPLARHSVRYGGDACGGEGGYLIEVSPAGVLRTVHGAKVDSYLQACGYGKDDIDMAVGQALTGHASYWLRHHYVTFDRAEYETGPVTAIPPDERAALRPAERPRTVITMPERLRVEGDLAWLLMACETVDRWLDETAPEIYRGDHPASKLANRWRRLSGPVTESAEGIEAHNLATGGNPRKGVQGSEADVLAEEGDAMFAALCAIQSVTKDARLTWTIAIEAAAKAYARVPDEMRQREPEPETAQEQEDTAVLRLMLTMPDLSRAQATAAVRDAAMAARGRTGMIRS